MLGQIPQKIREITFHKKKLQKMLEFSFHEKLSFNVTIFIFETILFKPYPRFTSFIKVLINARITTKYITYSA